jgi:uncharacterized protein (TIGR04255 family)
MFKVAAWGELVPLNLPLPFKGNLKGSPLSLVACQLRYAEPKEPPSAILVSKMRSRLSDAGFAYPKVDSVSLQSLTVDVGSATAVRDAPTRGWRLQTADSRWIVTIAPDTITLETTRYKSWNNDFQPRFEALVNALAEAVSPAVETRLGLRYVDVLNSPSVASPAGWRGLVSDGLLGPAIHPLLGAGVLQSQQQFTLEIDDEVRAVVRHGAFPDASRENASTYLIDTDAYRETLSPFSRDDVRLTIERLHSVCLSLFQAMITPPMFDKLKSESL